MAPDHNAHSNTTSLGASHEDGVPLHFLLLPFPAQGHITPMLALAAQLLDHGCKVTCVLTERVHRAMLNAGSTESHVHFVTISDGAPADDVQASKLDISRMGRILSAVRQQQGLLESLVQDSKATSSPMSCIVSDLMFPWVQDVADNCAIPRALFWTCAAAAFHLGCVAKAGSIHPGAPELEEMEHKLRVSARASLDTVYHEDPAETVHVLSFYERLDESSHILMNTFEALEGHLLPLLPSNTRYIGPCLPPGVAATTTSKRNQQIIAARAGSLSQEDTSCLRWLDDQEDRSVLFISFGSLASCTPLQVQEIALGLESSNHKFLWVARADSTTATSFPEGFVERTKQRGLVIPWAPQWQVLNHPAVGGFLTHCGWGSTLESMFMGVPMLCLPLIADQALNADLITSAMLSADDECRDGAGVGLGFEARRAAGIHSNHIVSSQEVETAVRALMGGPAGEELRKRACQLKEHARGSLDHQRGSSHAALISFINDIRRLHSHQQRRSVG